MAKPKTAVPQPASRRPLIFPALSSVLLSVIALVTFHASKADFLNQTGLNRFPGHISVLSVPLMVVSGIQYRTYLSPSKKKESKKDEPSLTQLIGIPFFTFLFAFFLVLLVLVLFGAPILPVAEASFSAVLLLTALVFLPIAIAASPDTFFQLSAPSIFNDRAKFFCGVPAVCAIFGAWLGAFPLPLDWDRSWQHWQLTCSLCAVLGHTAGTLFVCLLGRFFAPPEFIPQDDFLADAAHMQAIAPILAAAREAQIRNDQEQNMKRQKKHN